MWFSGGQYAARFYCTFFFPSGERRAAVQSAEISRLFLCSFSDLGHGGRPPGSLWAPMHCRRGGAAPFPLCGLSIPSNGAAFRDVVTQFPGRGHGISHWSAGSEKWKTFCQSARARPREKSKACCGDGGPCAGRQDLRAFRRARAGPKRKRKNEKRAVRPGKYLEQGGAFAVR